MKLATPTLLLDLFATHHRSGQLVDLAVRDTGMTPDEYALLSFLRRGGPTTPTEMSRALDLQGLLKSALLARMSGAGRVIGFTRDALRERRPRSVTPSRRWSRPEPRAPGTWPRSRTPDCDA